jgi:beta-glucosidase
VTNTGDRAGDDVVQLYGRDVVASVTRPVAQLLGYRRVHLEPGQSVVVDLDVPATRLAFTGRAGVRIVEPGDVQLWVGPTCERRETEARVTLEGAVHEVSIADERWTFTAVR